MTPSTDVDRPPRRTGPSRVARWAGGALVAVLGVVATVLFLVVASTFLPSGIGVGDVPVNVVGTILSAFSAYLVVVSVVLVVATVWLWRRRPTAVRRGVAVVAVLSLLAVAVIGGRQLVMAGREDVGVDVASLFDVSQGDTSPDENVTYTRFEGEDVQLSVWRPRVTDGAAAPVLVLVHGGGWVSGSRLEALPSGHARWFAEHGYLVVSADYSLSGPQRHLWDVAEGQIGCAMAWTAANAARYGGDAGRLVMTGDSAGGNLVLQAAYKGNGGTLASSCGGTVPRVDAVSALYPGVDMTQLYDNGLSRTFPEQYIGGSPQQYPERYRATTTVDHVGPQAPPTLLSAGTSDGLVPPDGSDRLFERLQDARIPSHLIAVPYGQHVFDIAPGGVGTQVWREATLRWFADHTG